MSIVRKNQIFPIFVGNALCLEAWARMAVGQRNLYNIGSTIPFNKLKRANRGGGKIYAKLVPCRQWEIAEKAAQRLGAKWFCRLGGIAELSQFMAQYPEEISKHSAVFALNEGSRWPNSDGDVCAVYACVEGQNRCLSGYRIDHLLAPEDYIIVLQSRIFSVVELFVSWIWGAILWLFRKSGKYPSCV